MNRTFIYLANTAPQSTSEIQSVYTGFLTYLRDSNQLDTVQPVRIIDMGIHDKGIVAKIVPSGQVFYNVTAADVERIVTAALKPSASDGSVPYKTKQIRIVLKNCGVIDPTSIEDYIAYDGYQALKKVVLEMKTSEAVIEEIKTSGLRGRGGAGFPTWMKWNFVRQMDAPQKYVICNADEGDPGAYMDRSVLEGDPHSIIEGMTIAGFASGASQGYCYIRAEYPLAIERIQCAIDQARTHGLLGKNILGSSFSFDIEIRLGAGAFVCGEETALIASIEGKRGTPTPRPPYPSVKGLWGMPTIINNVETMATVAPIIRNGGAWLASIGTASSHGTKVFALTGKVKNSGLIEVPMGITIREIVYDIGGGSSGRAKVKAVQTGGPSGGVIPPEHFDMPVDYESLKKLGSIMGSGGLIVMDESDCMVDIAKFYLGFCVEESCGKCAPCRIGGYQILQMLNDLSEGKGSDEQIQKLKQICTATQKASLCGLGQSAPNPTMSTLRFFEEEYREHINKKCRAGTCKALVTFTILSDKCKKCGICMKQCPANAISGNREKGYVINQELCVKCGQCVDVCKFGAVLKS